MLVCITYERVIALTANQSEQEVITEQGVITERTEVHDMKKIARIMLAMMMVLMMSMTAFADTITEETAVGTALKSAKLSKSEVKRIEAEFDDEDNVYEVEFIRKSNNADYSFEISAQDGKIREKSVEYKYKRNSSKKKIGKVAAMKKVAKFSGISYKTIKKGTCKYKYSKKQGKYEIKFTKGSRKYEYEVLAPTGKIVEWEWKLIRK